MLPKDLMSRRCSPDGSTRTKLGLNCCGARREASRADIILSGVTAGARLWRNRVPTIVGLSVVFGLVIHNVLKALRGPRDRLASIGFHVHRLDGGYWVDPQSVGVLARGVSIWAGVNWILAITLLLIVVVWERRPLSSIGWRVPMFEDFLGAPLALLAFHLSGFAANSLGFVPNPKVGAAIHALPWPLRTDSHTGRL